MANPTAEEQVNYPLEMELEVTSRIMAGFAANPAIFASNSQNGWGLVNCSETLLAGYARQIAREVIAACHKQVKP